MNVCDDLSRFDSEKMVRKSFTASDEFLGMHRPTYISSVVLNF